MNKITFKTEWRSLLILLITIALSLWAYPQLPLKVASHWDFQGQVNGWSSRNFHAIFFPALLIIMYIFFLLMPYFDPKKENYKKFAKIYILIKDSVLFVLFGVFAAATFSNLGYPINIGAVACGLIGLLLIVLGANFKGLKQNWFVGIRTPWAISSENVWDKTHRFGGKVFIIWGFLLILVPWLNAILAMIILIGGVLFTTVGISLYSYLVYRQEKK